MARALHDPLRGYYAKNIRPIGRHGDFITSPMMDSLLAQSISHWAAGQLAQFKCRNLIEIGPGEGLLSKQVLESIPWSMRWRVKLHLVEQSDALTIRQRQLLGNRATWHRSIEDAILACKGHAVLFSNELVDAFPVRRFRLTHQGWHEIFVQRASSHSPPIEVLITPSLLPDSSVFSFHQASPDQDVEVHESYHHWLLNWLPLWKSGSMLTIDYGAEVNQLYNRKPRGSIRAYWMQHCFTNEEILLRPGHQDLTADVNFTDLMQWSNQNEHTLSTLSDFIQLHAPSHSPYHPLVDQFGPGGAFLVLQTQAGAKKST